MNAAPSLILAFVTGLFGALHCLGMCSGIAGGLFVRCGQACKPSDLLAYHGTRILIYTALGVAGAALGRVLVASGAFGMVQGALTMTAGGLILLIGFSLLALLPATPWVGYSPSPSPAHACTVSLNAKPARRLPWLPMLGGLLNGFVPCGLVFSVAVKAAATADPLRAGLAMLAFGLGTLPAMTSVSLLGVLVGARARGISARLAGLAVIALGLWTLYEGFLFFDIMRGLGNWW